MGYLLLKEKICSCRSKYLHLKVDLILEGFRHSGKQSGCQNVPYPLFVKTAGLHRSVPLHRQNLVTTYKKEFHRTVPDSNGWMDDLRLLPFQQNFSHTRTMFG